ncbi:hypothetical protein SCATT_50450 [Streptantibioticus cattleyicolor NRRL 8057 = DSM 46488]|uniref:Uncharacterized protein n=1 Tax=Streptantibioticus cattleyicolor (strain ATCC 35852 / DSM 46488 / JCM 4925 / NBRC 14057 / NRRL 8057) TaxID=1003195 RepID=G8X3P3_STREN|nr:hypothetical protein SCATT_50450 [Streptantibioticus cattleyicolor NRRL 8057 = DSM 46488]
MNVCSWHRGPGPDLVLVGFEQGATITGPSYYACLDCRTELGLIPLTDLPFKDGIPRTRPGMAWAFPPAPRAVPIKRPD